MSSSQVLFLALAAGLTLLVLVRLLWPVFRGKPSPSAPSQQQLNARVYRDQSQELERDLSRGLIDAAHYEEARDELQRRLLQDVDVSESSVAPLAPTSRGRTALVALILTVPLVAALGYGWVGNWSAVDAASAAAAQNPRAKLAALVESLKQDPNNPVTWVEVARLFRGVGRYAEAARAFDKAGDHVRRDPDLLVEHADVLAAAAGDELAGRPMELVTQALALNPKAPMALMIKATHAYRQGRFDAAVADWRLLLTVLPAGSEEAANVQSNIDQALREGQLQARPGKGAAASSQAKVPAAAAGGISGQLSLSAAVQAQVQPGDTVFIVARPNDGSRAPLAVMRKTVADLPLHFSLDDSMAMVAGRTISSAEQIVVSARVSRSGQAIAQPGDWESEPSAPVKPGMRGLKLVIDRKH